MPWVSVMPADGSRAQRSWTDHRDPAPAALAPRLDDVSVLGTLSIIASAVLVGTILQRLSGTGVGLVVAPVLSLLLGPAFGVLVTNMTTIVSGLLIMFAVWSRIDWRAYLLIAPAAAVGAWPGAWLVSVLPTGWLSVLLGTIVVLALLVTVTLRRLPEWKHRSAALVAGFIGGFFNTTSGVAAPVMVIYSRVSRWDQLRFSATLQPIFMTMGAASVVAKLTVGSVGEHAALDVPFIWLVIGIPATVIIGIGIATALVRFVPVSLARRLAMTLAALGGVAAITRGAIEILTTA